MMRLTCLHVLAVASLGCAALVCGCSHTTHVDADPGYDGIPISSKALSAAPPTGARTTAGGVADTPVSAGESVGFDRNDYPGDATMAAMRKDFAFTGYWLTNPPGETSNTWVGKRALLRAQGWGFLVLANGRLDAEILKAQKAGTTPLMLAQRDAAEAVDQARREGFPAGTIIFLDQEEGGRLLAEQASYLLGWTEAVAKSAYRPGVYASGQPAADDDNITTINDIRDHIRQQHLHDVAMFDAQDACPPAPGCTLRARPLADSGEPGLIAWQYSQSPRRPNLTQACSTTYASDGNCYAPGFGSVFLDMDAAASTDPSHGR